MKRIMLGAAALVAASFAGMPSAEAAGGCGPGFFRTPYGFCRPFYGPRFAHGPYYRPYFYRRAFYAPRPFYRPYRPFYGHGPRFGYGYGPYRRFY